MARDFKYEELLENLPDYFLNKINDEELRTAISTEIENNPDFKNEFDSISGIMKSIDRLEFTEPPQNYFDTFLPKINERIYKKTESKSIFKSFSSFWKYAVPVAAIILFFIGYKTIFVNNEYIDSIKNDSEIVMKDYDYSDIKKTDTSNNIEEKIASENSRSNTTNTELINEDFKNNTTQKGTLKSQKTNNDEQINAYLNYSENSDLDDEVFFDDDMNYEQDFEKMSKDDQNDIIQNIKNGNL